MNKQFSILAIALSGLFILSGCGITTSPSVSYDPCTLLKTEDVAAIFPGGEIKNTKHDTEANPVGQKICFYSASDDDMKFVQLSLISTSDMNENVIASGQNAESLFASTKKYVEKPESIQGLGDEAYYGGSGLGIGKGISVLVKDKQVSFTIDMGLGFGNTDKQAHVDNETTIAKKILERL